MCIGSEQSFSCPDPTTYCFVNSESTLLLCLPYCDPVLGDCGAGQQCYLSKTAALFCAPANTEPVGLGETCQAPLNCPGAAHCREAAGYCEVAGQSCCVALCDQTAPDCPEGLTCTPLRDPSSVPTGFDHLGHCLPG